MSYLGLVACCMFEHLPLILYFWKKYTLYTKNSQCNSIMCRGVIFLFTTIFSKLGLWLRLECSLDCISGSVGHQQNIFILSLSAFLLKLKKCNYKKCNWVSGSPPILYKLVLSPVPIVHTNFQENLLMSYSWCPQLSR